MLYRKESSFIQQTVANFVSNFLVALNRGPFCYGFPTKQKKTHSLLESVRDLIKGRKAESVRKAVGND